MTVLITVLLEGFLVVVFALRSGRSWRSLLATSVAMNVLTQALLLAVLMTFWYIYLVALALAEVTIWAVETVILWKVRANGLSLAQAAWLSLFLNGASVSIGWFLPF